MARLAELAARATLERLLLAPQCGLGSEQMIAADRELAGAQIAMVAKRPAERVERVGQRGPGVLAAQRPTRTGVAVGAAARRARM